MYARFARLKLSTLQRNWSIVVGGEFARLVFGFVASVLIARSFGPALFSVYAVLGVVTAVASIIADFGLTESAIKRVANAAAQPNLDHADKRGRVFFWSRVTMSALVVIVGSLFADHIANLLYGSSQYSGLIIIALLGVFTASLSGAVTALFQATSHFGRMTVIVLSNAVLTAILAVIFYLMGQLTLINALVILGIGTSLVSFGLGYGLLPKSLTLRLPDIDSLKLETYPLFRFGFWLWLANILGALTMYLDIFLVNRLFVPSLVGAYALAVNLMNKVAIVNRGQRIVLMPTASALDNKQAVFEYTRRELMHSAGLTLLLLPLIPLIDPLINLVYGSEYAFAIPLFRLMLAIIAFDIMTLPLLLLCYTFNQPQLLTISNAVQLGLLIALSIALIPSYGLVGVIIARLVSKIFGSILVFIRLYRLYHSGIKRGVSEQKETGEY